MSGCNIVLCETTDRTEEEWRSIIEYNNGRVYEYVTKSVTHVVTTPLEVQRSSTKVQGAIQKGVPVVGESWLKSCLQAGHYVDEEPFMLVNFVKSDEAGGDEDEE